MKHFQHLEASLRARLECEQKRLFSTNVDFKQNQNKHNKNTDRYLPHWQANNLHSLSTQNDSQVNISDVDTNSSSTSCSGEYSPNTSGNANNSSTIGSSQRVFSRTVGFLCLYAAVVLLLYALIAFISLKGQQQSATTTGLKQVQDSMQMQMQVSPRASRQLSQAEQQQEDGKLQLEARLNQLERYIEVLALNLQSVETRLAEREKCSCSLSCSFNNTKYVDGSTWQQGCETCQCMGGKISCSPIKCQLNTQIRLASVQGRQVNKPLDNCDLVQIPGKCCPVCMKKCKYQNESLRHNQTFSPKDNKSLTCKCNDGLIKCEKDVVVSRNGTRNIAVIINEPLRRNLRSTIQKEDKEEEEEENDTSHTYTQNTKLTNAKDEDNKTTSQANRIADNNKRADESKQDDEEDKTSRRRTFEDAENG